MTHATIGNVSEMDHHTHEICHCPFEFSWLGKALTHGGFAASVAIFGIISNLLTVFALKRVRPKSITEKLLLIISVADLLLPLIHLTREVCISLDRRVDQFAFFRVVLFYLWHVFSVVSILLTLWLAQRRYIAIAYPHHFQSVCNWRHTRKVIWAVGAFSALLFTPVLFHNADPHKHDPVAHQHYTHDAHGQGDCMIDVSKEIFYVGVIIATLRLNNYLLAISYWFYVFIFLWLSPVFLALLSIKFALALSKKVTSTVVLNSKLAQANAKTKLILIVSLLSLVRDLPLGLLTAVYIFAEPIPACLTTMRLLAKEFAIVLSATNFVVLYFTNEKFKTVASEKMFSCRMNRDSCELEGSRNNTVVCRYKTAEDSGVSSSGVGVL